MGQNGETSPPGVVREDGTYRLTNAPVGPVKVSFDNPPPYVPPRGPLSKEAQEEAREARKLASLYVRTPPQYKNPEATAESFRNGAFHTGDVGTIDAQGRVHFRGRLQDRIRRRGENISAWEVEEAVATHPDVLEVAAIGVPSEVGEEDVAVLIVTRPNTQLDPRRLLEFVADDLPRFAVPRYVELVESLPKTPSERIDKGKIRERGITDAAWDADAS